MQDRLLVPRQLVLRPSSVVVAVEMKSLMILHLCEFCIFFKRLANNNQKKKLYPTLFDGTMTRCTEAISNSQRLCLPQPSRISLLSPAPWYSFIGLLCQYLELKKQLQRNKQRRRKAQRLLAYAMTTWDELPFELQVCFHSC